MNKKGLYATILVLCLTLFVLIVRAKSKGILAALLWKPKTENCMFMDFGCKSKSKKIVFGAYDPDNWLKDSTKISVDHYYFSWLTFDPLDFQSKVRISSQNKRTLFLSIEPWAENSTKTKTLLEDIIVSKYDDKIEKICSEFGKAPGAVQVSFAHEMDHDLTERYPWSGKESAVFIEAYKHFVLKCRTVAQNVKYIWSPVGDKKALSYWPGEEFVDAVGFPVYSFPEFDLLYHDYALNFAKSTKEKYDRLNVLNKPLIIVELGVAGDPGRKLEWFKGMEKDLSQFKNIKSVLFFNAKDHDGVWGNNLPTPDWRIDDSMISL